MSKKKKQFKTKDLGDLSRDPFAIGVRKILAVKVATAQRKPKSAAPVSGGSQRSGFDPLEPEFFMPSFRNCMHKLQLRGSSFFLPFISSFRVQLNEIHIFMISKITGLEPVGFIKNMKEVFQVNWPVKNEGLLYIYLNCKDLLSK